MRKIGNNICSMKVLTVVLLLFFQVLLFSNDIEITSGVDAEKIGIDDSVVFTITFKGISNPPVPDLSGIKDFKVTQTSRSSEFKFINGSSSSYIHFIYYLVPRRKGVLKIPSINYSYRGKDYSTPEYNIRVVEGSIKPGKTASVDPFSGFDDDFSPFFSQRRSSRQKIDIVLKAVASKSDVFRGEQIIYKVDLYTRNKIDSVNMLSKQSFPGFWQEWYPVKNSIGSRREILNGKEYNVYEIRKAALFPSETGVLVIPSLRFEMNLGLGLSFFSNPERIVRSTKPIKINVKALPGNAEGLPVGDFKFLMETGKKKVNINDFLNVKLLISGSGNIKMVEPPLFAATKFFRVFPAKISREQKYTEKGITGSLKAEIPFSFVKTGRISIPPVKFSYFDPGKKRVITVTGGPFFVDVFGEKDSFKSIVSSSGNELEKTGEDIDFIREGAIRNHENFFYRKLIFKFLAVFPFIISLALVLYIFVLSRYIFKSEKFLKQKRLKKVIKELQSINNMSELYDILEGYLTENTELTKSDISSERIEEFLYGLKLSKRDTDSFLNIFRESESSRFSPEKRSGFDLKDKINILIRIIKNIHKKVK